LQSHNKGFSGGQFINLNSPIKSMENIHDICTQGCNQKFHQLWTCYDRPLYTFLLCNSISLQSLHLPNMKICKWYRPNRSFSKDAL